MVEDLKEKVQCPYYNECSNSFKGNITVCFTKEREVCDLYKTFENIKILKEKVEKAKKDNHEILKVFIKHKCVKVNINDKYEGKGEINRYTAKTNNDFINFLKENKTSKKIKRLN